MDNKKNIKEYFEIGTFVVPEYQRGYKWSVQDRDKDSSLEFFISSLKEAFMDNVKEYFIEAVTVVEKDKKVILVDGQQRTTSLFLIFIFLGETECVKDRLEYKVRTDSHKWLNNQINKEKEAVKEEDEEVQDIFYFKKAIEQIEKELKNINKDKFSKFIKENVYLLYNVIPEDKAINTFIALNGLKAIMKEEELIKSDMLIKSSRSGSDENRDKEEQLGIEWKINEDRGRLARNWDKWLYWWNKKNVKDYFGTGSNHPLYYLLVVYWNMNNRDSEKNAQKFSFDNFKTKFIANSKDAKRHFEGLRKLQKTFEDLYNDWERYNLLGLSFHTDISKNDVLLFFIDNHEKKDILHKFTKWALTECTLSEISDNKDDKFMERREDLKSKLKEPYLYESEGKKQAYLQLLRMNVLGMNERKFDFEVFKMKSLEHICPQNPPKTDLSFNAIKDEINERSDTINSIGNLVLLNGPTNSILSNYSYDIKKQLLFNKIKNGFLLPHTLKVFSKSFKTLLNESETERLFDNNKFWQAEDVNNNREYFFNEFDNYYGK